MSGNPDASGSFREGRFKDEKSVETKPEQSSFFTRWGWPLFSLAALVIFELTASLTWSSLVFALRFGWKDVVAGCSFLGKDSVRARGWIFVLLHLASATSKVVIACFLTLLIMVLASVLNGGQPFFRQFESVAVTMTIVFLLGMVISGLLGLFAALTCLLTRQRMWVDCRSYQQTAEPRWPPRHFVANRTPRICFFVMIPVTALFVWMMIYLPMVAFVNPLNRNPPQWTTLLVFFSGGAGICFFIFGVFWMIRTVTAKTPFECWPELFELPIEESIEILESIELPNGGMGIHKEFSRKTRSQ